MARKTRRTLLTRYALRAVRVACFGLSQSISLQRAALGRLALSRNCRASTLTISSGECKAMYPNAKRESTLALNAVRLKRDVPVSGSVGFRKKDSRVCFAF